MLCLGRCAPCALRSVRSRRSCRPSLMDNPGVGRNPCIVWGRQLGALRSRSCTKLVNSCGAGSCVSFFPPVLYSPGKKPNRPLPLKLRAIFSAPDRTEAERSLKLALESWRKEHPKLAEWAKTAVAESLTVFDPLAAHRIRLRITGPYTHQPGTAPAHPHQQHLPQSRFLPAPRLCLARQTRRRARPTRSISTSTRNPDVMTTDPEIYRKEVAQSRAGRVLTRRRGLDVSAEFQDSPVRWGGRARHASDACRCR